MAGHIGRLVTPTAIGFTGAARKTLIQYNCHASVDVLVREFGFFCSDATATDVALLAYLEMLTTAGSGGTALAATDIVNLNRCWDATTFPFLGTGAYGHTSPGTQGAILKPLHIEQKNGGIVYRFPEGQEPVVGRGLRFGLSITAGADITGVVGYLEIEE